MNTSDFFNLQNAILSFVNPPPPGFVPVPPAPATVDFDIEWSGEIERVDLANEAMDFGGEFVKTGATIKWSSRQVGFAFVSEGPNPARNVYSILGHERNGVFFHGEEG